MQLFIPKIVTVFCILRPDAGTLGEILTTHADSNHKANIFITISVVVTALYAQTPGKSL